MGLQLRVQQQPLASFVVLAFLITWVGQGLALFLARRAGVVLNNEENLLHAVSVFTGGASAAQALAVLIFLLTPGPLIAAIVVTRIVGGRTALVDFWRRCLHWHVPGGWYLVIFAVPLVTAAVSLGAAALLGGLRITDYQLLLPVGYFVPFLIFVVIFTGLWEEPGWRGFALPYLQRKHTAENASWILGIIWGLWHVPFIFYYNLSNGAPVVMLLPVLAGLTIGIVGWTIVNTWVYNSTRSVFVMILLHGWYNTVNSYFVLSSGNMMAQTLNALFPWVIAIILLRVYGKENLSRRPRHQLEFGEEPGVRSLQA